MPAMTPPQTAVISVSLVAGRMEVSFGNSLFAVRVVFAVRESGASKSELRRKQAVS